MYNITVKQLYDYAIEHNYLNTDISIVLDIINRERNPNKVCTLLNGVNNSFSVNSVIANKESIVTPVNNTSIIDVVNEKFKDYTIEEVIELLSN